MFLLLDNRKLPLGQLGPAHCILEQDASFPPGDGEIVLIVDGRETRLPVFLPDGISHDQPRVTYQTLNNQNGNGHLYSQMTNDK